MVTAETSGRMWGVLEYEDVLLRLLLRPVAT
jgi:hypothetical protein